MKKDEFRRGVKSGSASVKIIRYLSKGYTYFRLEWWLSGKRYTENYKDEAAATESAITKASQLSRGDIDVARLSGVDRLIYGRALEFVKDTGLSLDVAASQLGEAHKLLNGTSLLDAIRFWAAHHPRGEDNRTVRQIVDEMLAEKERSGLRDRHLGDLRSCLNRFADAFNCPIGSVTAPLAAQWLDRVGASPLNYNNFRRVTTTLFRFAQKKRYVPAGFNPAGETTPRKSTSKEIEVFTANELAKLLASSDAEILPLLVLGAFAGLRCNELLRLDWSDVRLSEGVIVVSAAKAKTTSRRTVPISETLRAWLLPIAKDSGPIWTLSHSYQSARQRATAHRAGVVWKDNGLRHTWISCRLAELKDENRVALEAGTLQAAGIRFIDSPEPESIEIPYHDMEGKRTGFCRYRLPKERAGGQRYHQAPGSGTRASTSETVTRNRYRANDVQSQRSMWLSRTRRWSTQLKLGGTWRTRSGRISRL